MIWVIELDACKFCVIVMSTKYGTKKRRTVKQGGARVCVSHNHMQQLVYMSDDPFTVHVFAASTAQRVTRLCFAKRSSRCCKPHAAHQESVET